MKSTKFFSTFILGFAVICVVYGQYFSSSDGVNLPRSGKRSYLTSLLKQSDEQASSTPKSPSSIINIDGPSYYQTDKLSYRKLLSKLGKRYDQDFGSSVYYNSQIPPSQDYLTKEALLNYLYSHLHKLDHRNRDSNNDWDLDEVEATASSFEEK